MAAHHADIRRSAGGGPDVDLDLHGEHFRLSRREADRVQNAGETDEGAMDRTAFPDAQVDLVALCREVAADGAQTAAQAVAGRLALPGEVEVFGSSAAGRRGSAGRFRRGRRARSSPRRVEATRGCGLAGTRGRGFVPATVSAPRRAVRGGPSQGLVLRRLPAEAANTLGGTRELRRGRPRGESVQNVEPQRVEVEAQGSQVLFVVAARLAGGATSSSAFSGSATKACWPAPRSTRRQPNSRPGLT